jgi:hypothetical protein
LQPGDGFLSDFGGDLSISFDGFEDLDSSIFL